MSAKIGILTISDRASAGIYEDKSGPAISAFLHEVLTSAWEPVLRVIADEKPLIEKTLIELQQTTVVQETRSAFQEAMQRKFIDA